MAYESSSAFHQVYSGLPRTGPGSEESTLRALQCLPQMRPNACILDIGCGPGQQTLVLAKSLGQPIDAIDVHQPFLDELDKKARNYGLSQLIRTRQTSMDALDYAQASVDLIWCESAIYYLGVEKALRLWRSLLTVDGFVCFTEITWLHEQHPVEIHDFWQHRYPDMDSITGNLQTIKAAGFTVTDFFLLPCEDDWSHFYAPLSARIAVFRESLIVDEEMAAVLTNAELKMKMQKLYWGYYGHIFYICKINPNACIDVRDFAAKVKTMELKNNNESRK